MVLQYIYAIKISLLLFYLLCLLMTHNTKESESVFVLHLTGTHPNGQPLKIMLLFALPTDLKSSNLLLVRWCVLLVYL